MRLGGAGLRMSIEAGVDTIEHGSYLNEDPDSTQDDGRQGNIFRPHLKLYLISTGNWVRPKPRLRRATSANSILRAYKKLWPLV